MNIFKSVKEAVSVMDAASFYGIKINRSGLCNCPFHNDKTPSMKVDIRYYCFGCGATGDVIDYVGKLFGLSPLDAAKKIAMDFNIITTNLNSPSINNRSTPVNTDNNIIQRNNEYQLIRTFDAYVLDVLFSLHQYKEKLMAFKRDYAPASIDELDTCNPLFEEALMNLSKTDWMIEELTFGSRDEQLTFLTNYEEKLNMSKQDFQNLTKEQMEKLQILLGELQPSSVTEEIPLKEPPLSELFTRDEKGKILQSKNNCLLVLNHDPLFAGKIKYNEFSDKVDICGEFPWKRYSITYCDNDLRHIILYLESEYGLKKDGDIATAINIAAYDNSYNPIKEKLLSLKWDGISRLPDALHHFLGAAKSRLNTEILKVFMLGAIVRIFDPGHKFEYMPVLVGGQGAGKSTFLRLLAMEDRYFSDDIKKLDDDKIYARLQGHWINEIPEMLAVSSAKAVEETKKFLSTQSDIYRVPYETTAMDHPRQCVFAGTSNKIQFLPMDKSGNRRFLPVEVHPEDADCHILDDEKASRAYIEQLWAEVMEIYLAGDYSLVLPDDLQDELLAVQDKHSPEDPIETSIRNFLDDHSPDYVCTKMLFKEALGHIGYENPSAWECNVISEIMDHKMTDYKKISSHRFKEYGTQRAWKRVKEPVFRDIPTGMESEIPFLTKT